MASAIRQSGVGGSALRPPNYRQPRFKRRSETVAAFTIRGESCHGGWSEARGVDHAPDDELQGDCSSAGSHTRKEENGQSLASKAGAEESMGVEEIFEAGD